MSLRDLFILFSRNQLVVRPIGSCVPRSGCLIGVEDLRYILRSKGTRKEEKEEKEARERREDKYCFMFGYYSQPAKIASA
jgi:hypothetical protein